MKIRFLTDEFYKDYANCPELEKKQTRPYAQICLITYNNLIFAIPIRSHIKHKYAFFTNKEKTKGLDFSKSIVINDLDKYVNMNLIAFIDMDEFSILEQQENTIKTKLENYIKKYKKALKYQNDNKNRLLCKMSTLQYFHKELGIEEIGENNKITENSLLSSNPNIKKRIEEVKKATDDDYEVFEW